MRTLVCDIDNTIADARPRLARSLEAIGRPELVPTAFADYGGFKPHVSEDERRQLFRIFLSERFVDLDEPMPRAAEVLHAWTQEGHRLVYLTGRHDGDGDSMRAGTTAWLQRHGFPIPNSEHVRLWMKPRRGVGDRAYKRQALADLNTDVDSALWAGVGDLPYEGALYGEFGLLPVLTAELGLIPEDELAASHLSAVVVHDWTDIGRKLFP